MNGRKQGFWGLNILNPAGVLEKRGIENILILILREVIESDCLEVLLNHGVRIGCDL